MTFQHITSQAPDPTPHGLNTIWTRRLKLRVRNGCVQHQPDSPYITLAGPMICRFLSQTTGSIQLMIPVSIEVEAF